MNTEIETMRVRTYLPTPENAPIVIIHDMRTDEQWLGKDVDGIIHDGSGFLDPEDIGWRFHISTPRGEDVTDQYM